MEKAVGFIGLGIMGKPMAKNLLTAGVPLLVNDIDPAATRQLEEAGARAATLAEIGDRCGVIFTILPNGAIVREVLTGPDGISAHVRKGALVVDMSSVTPGDSQFCAEALAKSGAGFLDAPVSGGEEGAIQGTLAIMAGGAAADFERARPYFDILGSRATLVGGVGSGSITKLVNQVIVNLNIAALSEGLVLAKKAGADPEKVFAAIKGGLAGSRVLEDKAPRMIGRNFVPGGKLSTNHKDINNVMQAAHDLDVPMPMTALLFEIMQTLKVSGNLNEDHSAIIRYFERLAAVELP